MTAKITKLDNGLRIVTENRKYDNTFIGVWVGAGMMHETDEQNGLSHVLEHMCFKGNANKSALQLASEIESLGGYTNAYTTLDHTCYHVSILPENWKGGLKWLSEIVQYPSFPQDELDREKEVIIQEILRSYDNPSGLGFNKFMEAAYKGSALSRTVLGPADNIRKFTREDLLVYKNAGYTYDNIVISACGQVNHQDFVNEVKKLFVALPNEKELPKVKNKFKAKNIVTINKVIEQMHIYIGLEGITDKASMKEQAIYKVFKHIFDGGMSCRLFQEIRERQGLAYAVGLFDETLKDTGFFGVYLGIDQNKMEDAINGIKKVLHSMKTDITEEELQKAKICLKYIINASNNNNEIIGSRNGLQALTYGKVKNIKRTAKLINEVTIDDIKTFANKYITDDYSLGIVVPSEIEEEDQ